MGGPAGPAQAANPAFAMRLTPSDGSVESFL